MSTEEREDSELGEVTEPLFEERGGFPREYAKNATVFKSGHDLPPDVAYQNNALRRSRGSSALGAPKIETRVTSTFDARPINARDFWETGTGVIQATYFASVTPPFWVLNTGAGFQNAFLQNFTVPDGYIAILRGFKFKVLDPTVTVLRPANLIDTFFISIAGGTTGALISILVDDIPQPNFTNITGLGFRQNDLVPCYILANAGQVITLKVFPPLTLDYPQIAGGVGPTTDLFVYQTNGTLQGNLILDTGLPLQYEPGSKYG